MGKLGHYIELTIVIQPEDGQFAAHCKELGTASCGATIDEAARNIRDAVELHLTALEEVGERARFLKARGITVRSGAVPVHPKMKSVEIRPGQYVGRELLSV